MIEKLCARYFIQNRVNWIRFGFIFKFTEREREVNFKLDFFVVSENASSVAFDSTSRVNVEQFHYLCI